MINLFNKLFNSPKESKSNNFKNCNELIKFLIINNPNLYLKFLTVNKLIVKIPNIYLKDKSSLKWINYNEDYYSYNNWPNDISWDYDIKSDIISQCLKLNNNEAIIDCGAHIGDGSIPIAHALKINNRQDITVYAIDPSRDKCNFIKLLSKINKLSNVKVICRGLSSRTKKLYSQIPKDLNTGGTVWIETKRNPAENANNYYNGESQKFVTLDSLVLNKKIKHKIGLIHLDVEGHEDEAIIGAKETIKLYKPYITLETHDDKKKYFEDIIENNYKFKKRINSNNIFVSAV